MAEHVLYSHKSIFLHLLVLFNAIDMPKYVPSEFGMVLLILCWKNESFDFFNMDN